jgi:hypothetical protein
MGFMHSNNPSNRKIGSNLNLDCQGDDKITTIEKEAFFVWNIVLIYIYFYCCWNRQFGSPINGEVSIKWIRIFYPRTHNEGGAIIIKIQTLFLDDPFQMKIEGIFSKSRTLKISKAQNLEHSKSCNTQNPDIFTR